MPTLIYTDEAPSAEEYYALRTSVGWDTPRVFVCKKGLGLK